MSTTLSASITSITSAASTIIGPLTTTYTPLGSDCKQIFYAKNLVNSWLAYGGIGTASSTCMPTGFNRETAYYYSPGVCPLGYSAACSYFTTDTTSTSITRTVATCCPTGYTCFADRPADEIYGCTSYFAENEVLTINSVLFDTVTTSDTTSYPVIYGTATVSVTADVENVAAYGIIIERASDDPTWGTASSSTASSTSSSASTSTASPSSSAALASATSSADLATASSTNSLSSGAKAGVGIGVTLCSILIASGALFLCRRLRKRPQETHPTNVVENGVPEEYYKGGGVYQGVPSYCNSIIDPAKTSPPLFHEGGELHGVSTVPEMVAEQHSTGFNSELPNSEVVHELPDYSMQMKH